MLQLTKSLHSIKPFSLTSYFNNWLSVVMLLILVLNGCGIPLLSSGIPLEPRLQVGTLSPELQVQVRQTQTTIDDDPNLRLLVAYRFFTTDITEAEELYRSITNDLNSNFFGASTIIQPNTLGIQVLSNQSGFLTFGYSLPDLFTFTFDINPELISVRFDDSIITTISIPDQARSVGFFSFIRTYDQSTLQPLFSLVVGDESGRLIELPD